MKYKFSRNEIFQWLKEQNWYCEELQNILLALADKPVKHPCYICESMPCCCEEADKPTVSELCHNCNKDLTDTDKPKEECKRKTGLRFPRPKGETPEEVESRIVALIKKWSEIPTPLKTKPEIEPIRDKHMNNNKHTTPTEILWWKINEIIDYLNLPPNTNK